MQPEQDTQGRILLEQYFKHNGLLLCNENSELPSLFDVGGNWNAIVELIESGRVFYSKLYKGRTTYLSAELYAQIKPYRQDLSLASDDSRRIYDFLQEIGQASTQEIKNMLMLSGKAFTACMNELHRELLVTALARDKTMNASWSSFYWGTFLTWEERHPVPVTVPSVEALRALLINIMTEKQIARLIR